MANHLIIGHGYLGSRVGRQWRTAGHEVSALTRSREAELRAEGVTPILGDVTDRDSLILPQADTVLYAVGLDRSAGKSMRDVYVGGLTNVLDRLPTPRRFLLVSSTSVYGQSDGGWVTEDSPTEPAEENGRIVLECERLLRSRLPEAIILRFAGIYGPGRLMRRTSIEKGEAFSTDPDSWLNLIHVADGADAVVHLTEAASPGSTFNVADGSPVRRADFYAELARQLGASPPRITPVTESTNRQVNNHRLRETGFEPRHADHVAGLRQAIGGDAARP